MTPSRFPQRITIDLATFHQDGLQRLASLLPHEDPDKLLKVVISRGLVEMLKSEFGRYDPSHNEVSKNTNVPRAHVGELQSRHASPGPERALRIQRIDSSRVPFGMKQTFQEQHAMEAEHDKEKARFRRDLGLTKDVDPDARRHLPNAVSVRLSEEMRQGLEDFLDTHPEFDVEDALAVLVRRGLERTEELEDVVQTAHEKSASRILNLAEKLYARSKRRCR